MRGSNFSRMALIFALCMASGCQPTSTTPLSSPPTAPSVTTGTVSLQCFVPNSYAATTTVVTIGGSGFDGVTEYSFPASTECDAMNAPPTGYHSRVVTMVGVVGTSYSLDVYTVSGGVRTLVSNMAFDNLENGVVYLYNGNP